MNWERIGPTAWESGEFRIAAARMGEKFRYTLFRNGVMLETVDTADEAKSLAAQKRGDECNSTTSNTH